MKIKLRPGTLLLVLYAAASVVVFLDLFVWRP